LTHRGHADEEEAPPTHICGADLSSLSDWLEVHEDTGSQWTEDAQFVD